MMFEQSSLQQTSIRSLFSYGNGFPKMIETDPFTSLYVNAPFCAHTVPHPYNVGPPIRFELCPRLSCFAFGEYMGMLEVAFSYA